METIAFENYRCIKNSGPIAIKPITILLGANSSGKSSVLECLLLMMGMSNPDLPQALNRLRSRNNYAGVADARYMFNNLVLSCLPEITAELSNPLHNSHGSPLEVSCSCRSRAVKSIPMVTSS